ncbi:RNA polymerase sigma factor [Pelomonas sp. CA6]|uniref:RNA polymerase sigma factor n=1 Tax=Pelomonas sp. CA6 TaxID=2907999 RepID=UPI001F4C417B|nr:RNA polymerase sigma factor [Pelomonas sp. CA6]MCH7343347.1 RNA polymerase sigma factor [Pelomonas sp. CA6]
MNLIEMYQRRSKALERYVRRLLGNSADAADVSQEAFLRVYAAELGGQTPVSEALLYTVARNLALSELRKRTTRATDTIADLDALGVIAPGANPEAQLQERQYIGAVELAMQRMAPKCLEVFRLRKIDNLSHAEIGERLNISTKTVERHITRALQLCHEALADCEDGGRRAARRPPEHTKEKRA